MVHSSTITTTALGRQTPGSPRIQQIGTGLDASSFVCENPKSELMQEDNPIGDMKTQSGKRTGIDRQGQVGTSRDRWESPHRGLQGAKETLFSPFLVSYRANLS